MAKKKTTKAAIRPPSTRKKRGQAAKKEAKVVAAAAFAEHVLPADAIEDARLVTQMRDLREDKVAGLLAHVEELRRKGFEDGQSAMRRIAKRVLNLDLDESKVLVLDPETGTKLQIMSHPEAMRRAQLERQRKHGA